MKLLFGVEELEREDGETVDDEAGRLGVQGRACVGGRGFQQGEVELLDEVVAALVQAVDGALGGDDGGVGGVDVAGLVLAVPEVEVGAMLVEDELLKGRGGCGRGMQVVVTVEVRLVVEPEDLCGVEHV